MPALSQITRLGGLVAVFTRVLQLRCHAFLAARLCRLPACRRRRRHKDAAACLPQPRRLHMPCRCRLPPAAAISQLPPVSHCHFLFSLPPLFMSFSKRMSCHFLLPFHCFHCHFCQAATRCCLLFCLLFMLLPGGTDSFSASASQGLPKGSPPPGHSPSFALAWPQHWPLLGLLPSASAWPALPCCQGHSHTKAITIPPPMSQGFLQQGTHNAFQVTRQACFLPEPLSSCPAAHATRLLFPLKHFHLPGREGGREGRGLPCRPRCRSHKVRQASPSFLLKAQ